MHFLVLRGINRSEWDTKLLLTAVLASLVDCISLYHILKVRYCCLSPNGCFNPPSAPHLPPLPPTPYRRVITGAEKIPAVACRISYKMIAYHSYIITLFIRSLYYTTRETQCIQCFKLVFLKIRNEYIGPCLLTYT